MSLTADADFAAMPGVTLWRRIADELRLDIADGALSAGTRLPGEAALAERFGVNRHTVRAALKALERDGLVRARQGSGTFVEAAPAVTSTTHRHSAGLAGGILGADERLLGAVVEVPMPAVAAALWLNPGELVTRMETVTYVGEAPVSRTSIWFPAERLPAIDTAFAELGSVTAALRRYDIAQIERASTRMSARRADREEERVLALGAGAILLVTEGVDALPGGQPISYSLARFAAERVELVILGE